MAVELRPEERKAIIRALLPRTSCLVRKVAGLRADEQVLAANVDTLFLVSGLDQDFNLRRIERYLALAWGSDANPVIVLNKADLCADVEAAIAGVESGKSG